ncbi:Autophagy-related 2 [Gossypium australe]|uniref:Autophagy-related 2 n=1 Tax=Gossypium australe TaxID=47621 RepID=A0A5B6W0J4_9ROSI|nr:Autophagy-related 2 [Gossypium australe]
MNRCSLQENASVAAYDHQRGGPVVCPKPRRIGVLANNPNRPLRLHLSHQAEVSDLRAGAELLDIILKKQDDFGIEQSATQVASSPPFFCGSPPSRVSNPLVQDAQFRDERLAAFSTFQIPTPSSPSSSSSRKGGCVRMKFGLKPATVRVEGFDCLNRDRRNSSIPATA